MYRLVKVSKKNQSRIFNFFISGICILIGLYWLLCGFTLQINSAIISYNTEKVLNDESKIKVSHINENNKVFLEDGTRLEDSEIQEYIKVKSGSGTYYIPEGMMTIEITKKDARELGTSFILMNIVVFIMFICLSVWKHSKLGISIEILVYFIVTFISSVVLKFWCVEIYKTSFPIQWVLYCRFTIYSIGVVILYRYYKKRG